jgi:hypothetical protein
MSTYALALFVHILGALGLAATTGINLLVLVRLRRARTVAQARDLLELGGAAARVEPIVALALLGAGLFLTASTWGWQVAWIDLSLGALLAMVVIGGAIGGPRVAARDRAVAATPDGPIPAALAARLADPVLWTLTHVAAALEVGIVFLMVAKPELAGSLAALVAAFALGLATAAVRRRGGEAHVHGADRCAGRGVTGRALTGEWTPSTLEKGATAMTITAPHPMPAEADDVEAGGPDWRDIVFRGVAGLAALALLTGPGLDLVAPWAIVREAIPGFTPELHRWHGADLAAFAGLLVGGSLLALLPRPRRWPLLAQFVLLALAIFALASLLPVNGAALVLALVIGALVAAAYPAPRALLSISQAGSVDRPLLVLALAALPLLALNAWANAHLQFSDLGEHALHRHWMGSAALAMTLALAGLLAATGRPGWRALGFITGLTYLYLGMAALAIPRHDGSWGVTGGALALLGGAGFLAATVHAGRRARRSSPAVQRQSHGQA